ncbi:MAG: class I SAM-dependent methyltransferase [Solirubrobacteraceae bacterium]
MSRSLALYSETLDAAGSDALRARFPDGSTRRLHVERWLQAADEIDERCLRFLNGPVLDIGCGPGRHLHALTRRGVFGLGVDISDTAVRLARGTGASAIVASVFDDLPGTGHWQSALLLDGNIGIGGRPVRLLERIAMLLAPAGQILVELDAPDRPTAQTRIRLETADCCGEWFAWAEVSATGIGGTAGAAGMLVARQWSEAGRWFALLERAAITGGVALRAMPEVGGPVRIDYLGSTARGVVHSVDEQARRLEVTTEDGQTLTFELNRATATFTVDGNQTGPRLSFEAPGD